jgi:hypothetical protein
MTLIEIIVIVANILIAIASIVKIVGSFPRCSINRSNYNNFISVSIANYGTTQFTISKVKYFIAKDESNVSQIHESLERCISNIKQMKIYDIVRSPNGYLVPPGGELFLLAVDPVEDKIRQELRDKLKTIIVIVRYRDFLGFPHQTKLNLHDHFSRDPGIEKSNKNFKRIK